MASVSVSGVPMAEQKITGFTIRRNGSEQSHSTLKRTGQRPILELVKYCIRKGETERELKTD